jgi:hypothetical protein
MAAKRGLMKNPRMSVIAPIIGAYPDNPVLVYCQIAQTTMRRMKRQRETNATEAAILKAKKSMKGEKCGR